MTTTMKIIVAASLLALFAALGIGIYQEGQDAGRDAERALWLKQAAAIKDAELALVAGDSAARSKQQDQFNKTNVKVSDTHENEVSHNRRNYSADRDAADATGGLRIPAPVRAKCSVPAATSKTADAVVADEGAAATVRLPRELEESLWARAELADTLSAQIRAMQEWVKSNGFYGPETPATAPLLDRMIAVPNQTPKDQDDR